MTTKIELSEDLKKVKNELKTIPSRSKYEKYGKYNPRTFRNHFGTWNNALQSCFGEVVRIKAPNRPIIICPVCNKKTKNPKYCSRSCSAKINSSLFPKRPKRKCLRCQSLTQSKTHYCAKCLILNRIEEYGEKSIKDFTSTYARHKYQSIRNHAHQVAKYHNLKPSKCSICHYNNKLDLCHIKGISKFDKNTKLNIVNDIKNLIYLCPNHHWDLDHSYLKL